VARSDPAHLRYLAAADVLAAMPPLDERLALAERTMTALVGDAELPPKIGVHPRPAASFAHAMPAYLRGAMDDGADDRLGMKWVTGFPANAAAGLPQIAATVVLNDARTGVPIGILDGGQITAQRTAAVSGVAIRRFGPRPPSDRPLRVTLLGAGVQARSHLPVLAHVLPGAMLVIHDRHPERAMGVVREAGTLGSLGGAATAPEPVRAVEGADVVVTTFSFGPDRQLVPAEAFAAAALVVAVDYDVAVPAGLARDSAMFVVDDRGQFLANREAGVFAGYPDPDSTLGEAIMGGVDRPHGTVLVTHLGVGLADVVFSDAILRRAEAAGLGTVLER
jgi:ornithine cyclodeaminase/alanine dehydrogenase-like protein (mu-crystallin family)